SCVGPEGGDRGARVLLEIVRAPFEQVVDRLCCEAGADERLVQAVPGERVDEPRRVADDECPPPGEPRFGPAHRQPAPPYNGPVKPSARAVTPLTPSAPTSTFARILAPPTVAAIPSSASSISSTFVPSRKSAPARAAAAAR